MLRSTTGMRSSSRTIFITYLRVMPSRMSSVTGGVMTSPSLTMNRFSAEPSETWPSTASTMASSKPDSSASFLASAEFA